VPVCARQAAIAATDAVIDAEIENAFARYDHRDTMRAAKSMGFCMFNNVAIAARHALDVRGLQRAIVDSMCITAMAPKIFP
jgi:acetoin utilization deacetylase AcuC-like enzyme